MLKVIVRRPGLDGPSPEEAADVVESLKATILHRGTKNMLVQVADMAAVEGLRRGLPGWLVSLQGPKIPIPDTRLKVRSPH